jgi:PhzF family phenazine biosynthesis protein
MKRDFKQVDVFGSDTCTGNPLAVVFDAAGLTDEEIRRFSVWSNLSECTFLLPPTKADADYRVRIFSKNTELPFAGHPTLGTARAWLEAGGVPKNSGFVVQECEIGLVKVRIEGERLAFAAPARLKSGPVDSELLDQLVKILGITHAQVVDAEWLDNGPGWVGLLLDSAQTVLNLRPDASMYPGRWDIGVIGAYPEGSETLFELRAFMTESGEPLQEDPVTGSLNAAAAEWMIATKRARAPYLASQGTAIGRRGRISISEAAEGLWVGGKSKVVVSGSISLAKD